MYKIKIINYKPYEYELLQTKLNELGKQGYRCDDLSLISFFKKRNHPIYYQIDFFNSQQKDKRVKLNEKLNFFDPYLDENFQPIYHKNGMYVFVGDQPLQYTGRHSLKDEFLQDKQIVKFLNYFLSSIGFSLLFIFAFMAFCTINSFLNNGMLLFYIGVVGLFITCIYRCFQNYSNMKKMKFSFEKKDFHLSIQKITKSRRIYKILFIIFILLSLLGLTIDFQSSKKISPQDHQLLGISELGIEKKEYAGHTQSSLVVPHFYTTLEIGKDNSILYTKEYDLLSEKTASNLFKSYSTNPKEINCTRSEIYDNVLYGYNNDYLTSFVILKDKKVFVVTFFFELTDKQKSIILSYYNS